MTFFWERVRTPPLTAFASQHQAISGPLHDAASVLLAGHSHDLELASVATLLRRRGVPVVVYLTDLPLGHRLPISCDQRVQWRAGWCRYTSAGASVAYHYDRSLRQSRYWSAVPDEQSAHAAGEVDVLAQHWLRSVSVGRWINPLDDLLRAENKLTQLAVAQSLGLRVPKTIVVDSAASAADFAAGLAHGAVVKAMSGSVLNRFAARTHFIYTQRLGRPDEEDPAVWAFPRMVQERVIAERDIRVTIIGPRVFAAGLSRHGVSDDWRRDPSHRAFESIALPDEVRSQLLDLAVALGLSVVGIDLLEADGRFYFLEANASPAFLWLERTVGWSLSAKVAEQLCHEM